MKPIEKSDMKQANVLSQLRFGFLKIRLLGGGGGAPKTKKRIKYHLDVSASDLCR
jgi:hypothetical protein